MNTEILIGLGSFLILNIILLIILVSKVFSLQKRINLLVGNTNESSIEDAVRTGFRSISDIKSKVETSSKELTDIVELSKKYFTKFALVNYNGYGDMGGNYSFVLCMLNKENSGIMLNSLHSKTTTRVYAKTIMHGQYEGGLSSEEGEALSKAITS